MNSFNKTAAAAFCILVFSAPVLASEDLLAAHPAREAEIVSLREEIGTLRILLQDMDQRLQALEGKPRTEPPAAETAVVVQEPSLPPRKPPGTVPTAQSPNIFNPRITMFGNIVGRGDNRTVFNEDGNPVNDRINLREVELDARGAIDPYADGVVILSYGSEVPNEFEVSVEEAYVNLKRFPFGGGSPAGLKLRMGRMRTEFGRWNLLHTHDLPQTTRPLPLQTFLGKEGFIQNGIAGSFFLPTPGPSSALGWTLQVLDGGNIPVAEGNQGEDLAFQSRIKWFRTFGAVQDLEIGISNYYGNNDVSGNQDTFLSGLDFFYKWKPLAGGEWRSFILGGELYYASIEQAAGSNATPFGVTGFAQYQFSFNWYGGLRYDFTNRLEDDGMNTEALTLYTSFYTSEFLRFRLGFETRRSDIPEQDGLNTGLFEVNFVFGSHPVEPYWVNR